MGVSKEPFSLDPKWVEVFKQSCGVGGLLNYEDFSKLALFNPDKGYYTQQKRKRVGKDSNTDFYTSSSHTGVFPELVIEASRNLLSQHGRNANHFTLIELGAEPKSDPWASMDLPFESYRILRLGDNFEFPEKAVIYSNELFDAQPFFRWLAVDGQWKPIHLEVRDGKIREVIGKKPLTCRESEAAEMLPKAPGFEYHIDLSTAALELCKTICEKHWTGLFLAFDYGKMWKQLTTETPQGTARAYRLHQQRELLFHHPGEQDLTTHVCWDHLIDCLTNAGFQTPKLRTQSRFLMEEANRSIESIVTASKSLTDKRKSQLLELISPGFFGQKFQVISSIR